MVALINFKLLIYRINLMDKVTYNSCFVVNPTTHLHSTFIYYLATKPLLCGEVQIIGSLSPTLTLINII